MMQQQQQSLLSLFKVFHFVLLTMILICTMYIYRLHRVAIVNIRNNKTTAVLFEYWDQRQLYLNQNQLLKLYYICPSLILILFVCYKICLPF